MFALIKRVYEQKYKQLVAITIAMLIIFSGVLLFHKLQTGEFIAKDISLKGGLLVTVHSDKKIDIVAVEKALSRELGSSVSVKRLQAIGGVGALGYSFTLERTEDTDAVLTAISKVTGIELTKGTYTIEEVSSGFSTAFWQSTLKAIVIAFVLMIIVVLIYFRQLIPSFTVILAAVCDLIGTLAIMSLLGIKLSIAGIAALLMLIGYSIDTDILLATRMLKRTEGEIFERVKSSVKTGMTMQLTAIAALTVLWIVSPAEVLKQISAILIIGLLIDIPNTWVQNVGTLRWYLELKEKKQQNV
ncbi:MAG: hypothetical protein QW063_02890 [Candidatus Nanoarchaeia archaeon]